MVSRPGIVMSLERCHQARVDTNLKTGELGQTVGQSLKVGMSVRLLNCATVFNLFYCEASMCPRSMMT